MFSSTPKPRALLWVHPQPVRQCLKQVDVTHRRCAHIVRSTRCERGRYQPVQQQLLAPTGLQPSGRRTHGTYTTMTAQLRPGDPTPLRHSERSSQRWSPSAFSHSSQRLADVRAQPRGHAAHESQVWQRAVAAVRSASLPHPCMHAPVHGHGGPERAHLTRHHPARFPLPRGYSAVVCGVVARCRHREPADSALSHGGGLTRCCAQPLCTGHTGHRIEPQPQGSDPACRAVGAPSASHCTRKTHTPCSVQVGWMPHRNAALRRSTPVTTRRSIHSSPRGATTMHNMGSVQRQVRAVISCIWNMRPRWEQHTFNWGGLC